MTTASTHRPSLLTLSALTLSRCLSTWSTITRLIRGKKKKQQQQLLERQEQEAHAFLTAVPPFGPLDVIWDMIGVQLWSEHMLGAHIGPASDTGLIRKQHAERMAQGRDAAPMEVRQTLQSVGTQIERTTEQYAQLLARLDAVARVLGGPSEEPRCVGQTSEQSSDACVVDNLANGMRTVYCLGVDMSIALSRIEASVGGMVKEDRV